MTCLFGRTTVIGGEEDTPVGGVWRLRRRVQPSMATTGKPEPTEKDPAKGLAEPEALIDGAEDDADTASRLSMAASDPPASWAGPDKPPTNKER